MAVLKWGWMQMIKFIVTFFLLLLTFVAPRAYGARLKDIADIEGVRGNQLYGFGLVVGLNGTGDGKTPVMTRSLANFLEHLGVRVSPEDLKVKNVAAVMVTANMDPFVRGGSKLDVTLSSIGDATSLVGGVLLLTHLKGVDGETYALAQGPISVGGYTVGQGQDVSTKNHPTVAKVTAGATVEKDISFDLFRKGVVRIVLKEHDFTTVVTAVDKINDFLRQKDLPLATALDSRAIEVPIYQQLLKDDSEVIKFISLLEQLEVVEDRPARIVVNERTGTIVVGDTVRISRVALAHGNLNIAVSANQEASQPAAPFAGTTEVIQNQEIGVSEDEGKMGTLGGEVTLSELVRGLNALGATPRDLISIFLALKEAGALHGELEIM